MKIISGIYRIVNVKNERFYLGSSKDILRRWRIHKYNLRHNKHHNDYLQRAWNKYGESSFEFQIIKEMERPPEKSLLREERLWVDKLNPEYNVGSIGGGDNLSNHPHKKEIIERMTQSLRRQARRMTIKEKKKRWSRGIGKDNPNWRGGKTYCKCGNRISSVSMCCISCMDKSGKHNPFYGRHHNDETKACLRRKMKGRLPTNTNPIILNGISYMSQAEASRKLGVSTGTISNWIREKFKPQHQI